MQVRENKLVKKPWLLQCTERFSTKTTVFPFMYQRKTSAIFIPSMTGLKLMAHQPYSSKNSMKYTKLENTLLERKKSEIKNRNQVIAIQFQGAVEAISSINTIEHKFLESGHTHMECDSMHSAVYHAKKHTAI